VNNHMMAAVLYGKEHLQVEPVAVPTIESGDILVRVKVALTCGTDVKVFRRGYHARMIVPPAVFGHELAGDVVAIGKDVKNFKVGQRVVAANSAPCGECFFCNRGLENLCEDLLFNNGAYAEYIRIPARIVQRNTYLIPAQVGYQDAALVEPLACVVRGFEESAPRPGDTVAIVGLGPIGLMFVKMAKLSGCRVIAVGRRKTQLDRAAALGADDLFVARGEQLAPRDVSEVGADDVGVRCLGLGRRVVAALGCGPIELLVGLVDRLVVEGFRLLVVQELLGSLGDPDPRGIRFAAGARHRQQAELARTRPPVEDRLTRCGDWTDAPFERSITRHWDAQHESGFRS